MTASSARRPRTRNEERAYGSAHRRRRKSLLSQLATIGAAPCPRCGLPMTPEMRLHLDHSDPLAKQRGEPGDQLCHAVCNEGDGGRAGNAIMRAMSAGMLPLVVDTDPEPKPRRLTEAEISAEMARCPHRDGCKCREAIAAGWKSSRCW